MVSPGPVHTHSIEKATGGGDNAERLLSELSKDIPLGRPGKPDEIAKAVLFLASEDASYVNGAELFVDGGMVQISPKCHQLRSRCGRQWVRTDKQMFLERSDLLPENSTS